MSENKAELVIESEFVSPYQLCKLVNKALSKSLPPQMFYNYVKKAFIKSSLNSTQHIQISRADALAWFAKYTTPKSEKALEIDSAEESVEIS
jgi:hypothetical protein